MSNTNSGVLHSTKPGIHGERDSGVVGSHTGSGLPSSTHGSGMTGSNTGNTGSGLTGSGTSGPQYTGSDDRDRGLVGSGTTTSGPHSSSLANKADPRIDSDRDGSRNTGNTGYGSGSGIGSNARDPTGLTGAGSGYDSNTRDTGLTGSHNTGTTGYGSGTSGAYPDSGVGESTTAGPHSSNLANKADPRVDSDRDGSRGMGSNTHGSGMTGSGIGGTGSGLTGNRSEYDSSNTGVGSGLGGSHGGSGLTGSGSGMTGSGTHGSHGNQGLVGKAEQYMESSERHHRGDGHPEDITHPGPHVTGTAKALDPHLN